MVHRGSKPREAKKIRNIRMSTLADKLRRHKNKRRIWRRCVAKIAFLELTEEIYEASSMETIL